MTGSQPVRSIVISAIAVICLFLSLFMTPAAAQPLDHSLWDEILMKYTENGLVEYSTLKKDSSDLDAYLAMLTRNSASGFESWSREEQMVFWINAYNAVTIHGILLNYPIRLGGFFARRRFPQNSIRQIKDFWDTELIELAGRPVTLDEIEHEELRGKFKDPRIHFSIVCASTGCPVLLDRAYTVEHLSEQLGRDAIRFIADPGKVRLDRENNVLYVSEIFKWYREDFYKWERSEWESFVSHKQEPADSTSGSPTKTPALPAWLKRYGRNSRGFVKFIVDYAPSDMSEYIVDNSPDLKYIKYDWTLNEKVVDR